MNAFRSIRRAYRIRRLEKYISTLDFSSHFSLFPEHTLDCPQCKDVSDRTVRAYLR